MKKLFAVSFGVVAAAGALMVQTTPVQASPLVSTAGTSLPKFGGGEQQWLAASAKSAASNAVAGVVGGAVCSAVLGTPAIITAAAANSASGSPWNDTGAANDEMVFYIDSGGTPYMAPSSSTIGPSGGTIARFGAAGGPTDDHFGTVQNPGGPVSQPGPGDITAGKLAKIGASRLD